MGRLGREDFVLLVEADPAVGLDLADALEAAGYLVTGPIRTAAEAEAWLARWTPALAVLDPGAAADGAGPRLARTLRERGVPFLVHAARDDAASRSPALAGAPWLAKPAWPRDVIDMMSTLTPRAGRAGRGL